MATDAWVDFVAGWCSGGAAVLVCQPVDTVLTRLQAGTAWIGVPANVISSSTTTTSTTSTATGAVLRPVHVARGLVSQAGFQALWRGSSAMIGAVPFQNALLMSGYGLGKRWSTGDNDDNNNNNDNGISNHHSNVLLGVFVGGCTGGVVQSFLMSPVELIKVHQQVIGKGALSATAAVSRGIFSQFAWKGLGATLLRDGIPHGVWFASYEWCKTNLDRQIGGPNTTHSAVTVPIVSGAFAATTAWGVGYPFDLIKTRIQAGGKGGIWGTAKELLQEPGGLYRGFTLKLVRAIPASMIGFFVYESVKNELSKK